MRKVYKYVMGKDVNKHEIPEDHDLLFAGRDPDTGNPAIWVEVNTLSEPRIYEFKVYGTGHKIEYSHDEASYLGTAICGNFVWHIYAINI